MSAVIYFFLVLAAMGLAVSLLAVRRGALGRSIANSGRKLREGPRSYSWDPLTAELSRRIFRSEDSDFVGRETPPHFARAFREERTALSLDWLRELRNQVNLSMGILF